jgi:hypothetical protein
MLQRAQLAAALLEEGKDFDKEEDAEEVEEEDH